MHINRMIIVSTTGIVAIAVFNSVTGTTPTPITPILIGGYILMLLLSIADLAGGQISAITGGIAMVALLTMVLTQVSWDKLRAAAPGGTGVTPTGGGTSSFK